MSTSYLCSICLLSTSYLLAIIFPPIFPDFPRFSNISPIFQKNPVSSVSRPGDGTAPNPPEGGGRGIFFRHAFFWGGSHPQKRWDSSHRNLAGPRHFCRQGRTHRGGPHVGPPHISAWGQNQRTLGPVVVFQMISEPNPRLQQRTPLPQIPDA